MYRILVRRDSSSPRLPRTLAPGALERFRGKPAAPTAVPGSLGLPRPARPRHGLQDPLRRRRERQGLRRGRGRRNLRHGAIQAAIDDQRPRRRGRGAHPPGDSRCNVKVGARSASGAGRYGPERRWPDRRSGRRGEALRGPDRKLFELTDIYAGDNYVQLTNCVIDGDKAAQSTGWVYASRAARHVAERRRADRQVRRHPAPGRLPIPAPPRRTSSRASSTTSRSPTAATAGRTAVRTTAVNGLIAAKNYGYGFQNEGRAGGYNGGVSGTNWNAWSSAKGAYKLDWTVSSLVNFIAGRRRGRLGWTRTLAYGMSQFVGAHLFSLSRRPSRW